MRGPEDEGEDETQNIRSHLRNEGKAAWMDIKTKINEGMKDTNENVSFSTWQKISSPIF